VGGVCIVALLWMWFCSESDYELVGYDDIQ
jgi:hypothetical protein